MNLEEYLNGIDQDMLVEGLESRTVKELNGLQEAYLIELRFDAIRSTAWLLLDCRNALQFSEADTGILTLEGVSALAWDAEPRTTARTQWTITGWSVTKSGAQWAILAEFAPSASLTILTASGEFTVGDIPNGEEAPPNFGEASEAEMRAGLAGWDTEFNPRERSSFG